LDVSGIGFFNDVQYIIHGDHSHQKPIGINDGQCRSIGFGKHRHGIGLIHAGGE